MKQELLSEKGSFTSAVFLTHTVQMKLKEVNELYLTFIAFLTHTVQMKPSATSVQLLTIPDLLNPHGSDETGGKRVF